MMKRTLLVVVLVVILAVPSAAHADMAPPAQPPGSNLQPGVETTQVRMEAETVVIAVQSGSSTNPVGQAQVTADFTMHNTGTVDETMAARFPIGSYDGYAEVKEIQDFQIKIRGKKVPYRRIEGENPYETPPAQVPWAEFDITFPAGEDVPVQVRYTLDAAGEYPMARYRYILSTGAAWKDTIGTADIIVQLPYEANIRNVVTDSPGVITNTTPHGEFNANTIRWHYTNLEPTPKDNFELNLVSPSAWLAILDAENEVKKKPQDGEAWGRLGLLCKQATISPLGKPFRAGAIDQGGAQLFERSVQAYNKAVTLLPKDALWHAGYAELLGYHAYFDHSDSVESREEAVHSIQEIHTALSLAPNDPKVREVATMLSNMYPDGMWYFAKTYNFPWLTATPTLEPPTAETTEMAQVMATSTNETARPTLVASVSPSPQPAPSSASKPSLPICGGVLVLPLLALGAILCGSRWHAEHY